MSRRTSFLVLLLLISTSCMAQWGVCREALLDFQMRAESMKIASDGSVWLIAGFDSDYVLDGLWYPSVYRSTDGGVTWKRSNITDAGSNSQIWDISPVDSSTAYVSAYQSGILRTVDGGENWEKIDSYPYKSVFIHFFDRNEGWVYSGPIRMTMWDEKLPIIQSVTKDGGKTWVHIGGQDWEQPPGTSLPDQDTTEMAGSWFSSNSGYACRGQSIIIGTNHGDYWLSKDRGYHWARHASPFSDSGIVITMAAIKDSMNFMVAGHFVDSTFSRIGPLPLIRKMESYGTRDGGSNWIRSNPPAGGTSLAYVPGTQGTYLISGRSDRWGGKGTAVTFDPGGPWTLRDTAKINTMAFLSLSTGYGTYGNFGSPEYSGQIFKWGYKADHPSFFQVGHIIPWLAVLIAGLLIWLFHRHRVRLLKRQSRMSIQLIQLEKEALRAQMSPHFIFNSLNALQSYINHHETENSNVFLGHFSQLIRGTLNAGNQKRISLEMEMELLRSYLELEKLRFGDKLEYSIHIDKDIEPDKIEIPSMITQPILENAILHGYNKLTGKRSIELTYHLEGEFLVIIVRDNGHGFSRSGRQENTGHKSTGLSNTRKRLKLINPANEMEITEMKDLSGEITGTEVKQIVRIESRSQQHT